MGEGSGGCMGVVVKGLKELKEGLCCVEVEVSGGGCMEVVVEGRSYRKNQEKGFAVW